MRLPHCIILSICSSLLLFSCEDIKNDQQETTINKKDSAYISKYPSWIMQGNVYEVNVRQYTPEGTFRAFEQHLDRLKEMGVQTLWFMPINPISVVDRKGLLGSYYAVSSFTSINPEYGDLDDWKHLVSRAHKMGFKVLIDWVPNHTGADHPWLTTHSDFYVKDSITGEAISQFDWTDTRKLDYHNKELVDTMINCMMYWINETGIDGFRCDQAFLVGEGLFWEKCIRALKDVKDILMLAESEDAWMHREGFDISYTWKTFHAMNDIAAGRKSPLVLDSINAMIDGTFPSNALMLYFTSNHDENSWNKADYGTMPGASHAPFAVLTQTTARSVPLIYSGQEEPFLDSLSFFYKDTIQFGKFERADFYRRLLELRKKHVALSGDAGFRKVDAGAPNQLYAYLREKDGDKVLVILNLSAKDAVVHLRDEACKGKAHNVFLFDEEDPTAMDWRLEPWGYVIYEY